eukprot:snap_masked-scaffold_38-processed-gene-2.46-mRNA-1 protein AED:1.00 eAED:1.00 QI:0/0/0/0/1/1/2/0/572
MSVSYKKNRQSQKLNRRSRMIDTPITGGPPEKRNFTMANPAFREESTTISPEKSTQRFSVRKYKKRASVVKKEQSINEVGLEIHPEGYPCARRNMKKPVRCSDQLIALAGGDPTHSIQIIKARVDHGVEKSIFSGLGNSSLKVIKLKEGTLSIYLPQHPKKPVFADHQGDRVGEEDFSTLYSDGRIHLMEKILVERVKSIHYTEEKPNVIGLTFADEEETHGQFTLRRKLQHSLTRRKNRKPKRKSEWDFDTQSRRTSVQSMRHTVFSSLRIRKGSTERKVSMYSKKSSISHVPKKSVHSLQLHENNNSNKIVWLQFINETSAQTWLFEFLTEVKNQALLNEKYFHLYKEKVDCPEKPGKTLKRVRDLDAEFARVSNLQNVMINMELVLRTSIDLFALCTGNISLECNRLRAELGDLLLEKGKETNSEYVEHEGKLWKKFSDRLLNKDKTNEDLSHVSRGHAARDMDEMLLFLRDFVADEVHYSMGALDDVDFEALVVGNQYGSLIQGNEQDMIKLAYATFQRFGIVPACFQIFFKKRQRNLLDKARAISRNKKFYLFDEYRGNIPVKILNL